VLICELVGRSGHAWPFFEHDPEPSTSNVPRNPNPILGRRPVLDHEPRVSLDLALLGRQHPKLLGGDGRGLA
jgi:hypothetical protein